MIHKIPFNEALIDWFDQHQRPLPWRKEPSPFAIWTSEVMAQQTRIETVIPYYDRFRAVFPTIAHLAAAPIDQVLKQWEGLGYYARARNFHRAAGLVCAAFDGQVPDDPERFLSLPGVGPYIQAAVMSMAFNHPLAVVDGNVKRVLARLLVNEHPVNATGAHRAYSGPATEMLNKNRPGDHNQAMMELGAMVCTERSPTCHACPVQRYCQAFQHGRVETLPVRLALKRIPTVPISVGVVIRNGRVLICRRKEEGLLGGLWEFPGGKREKGETPKQTCERELKEETNLQVAAHTHLVQVKHAYTHFRIVMDVFVCEVVSGRVLLRGPTDFAWVGPKKIGQYPFPAANNRFMARVKRLLSGC